MLNASICDIQSMYGCWCCCRVTSVAAGGSHSVALTVGGQVLAFGSSKRGQLGLGSQVQAWGPTDVSLPLLPGERFPSRAVQVACGTAHTLVLALGARGVRAYAAGE
jgi:alpha-tubulin suppressor-like RCC1 family protein